MSGGLYLKTIKVMTVFGTRPEAIKMAPVIKMLKSKENIETIICVTAQHRQMLDQVLKVFNLKPDIDLNIMQQNQTLGMITIKALEGLENAIKQSKPDIVLVHGDTTTTFVAALAAYYNQTKIGHVEAGLRTYDKYQPFPEEMNRKLTTVLADLNFCPTDLAKDNLLKENIPEDSIFITGNTVIDALSTTLNDNYKFKVEELNKINFKTKRIITMTAHRRENLGKPLENICNAVLKIVKDFEDVEIVYAVHKNPVVQNVAYKILSNNKRIHLTEPLDIEDMHNLMNRSYLVMTDSGGLQEEVPSMGKPVLVLRNVTERPEGIKAGTLKLVGTDQNNIYSIAKQLLENKQQYAKMANAVNPFGDGKASERIVDAILYYFDNTNKKPENFEWIK